MNDLPDDVKHYAVHPHLLLATSYALIDPGLHSHYITATIIVNYLACHFALFKKAVLRSKRLVLLSQYYQTLHSYHPSNFPSKTLLLLNLRTQKEFDSNQKCLTSSTTTKRRTPTPSQTAYRASPRLALAVRDKHSPFST